MTDLKASANLLFLRDDELRLGMELLFAAYRDLLAASEGERETQELGAAHLRALFIIVRYPGLSVGDLLSHLGITKQSLSRVLNELVDRKLVSWQAGKEDRRQKLLEPTPEGIQVDRALTARQRRWLAEAYRAAGPQAVDGFRTVLTQLAGRED